MEEMAEAIRENMSDIPDELRRDAQKLLNRIDQM
jgi:BMFP domain-containing protein YqiC